MVLFSARALSANGGVRRLAQGGPRLVCREPPARVDHAAREERVLCVVVDDGVSLGACSSHDVSAPLSQQVRDVDYSYQLRSNTVLSQLRVTVVAGHSGALVG